MRLLLISNSTNSGEPYLQHALPKIHDFTGNKTRRILFIPYAAVTIVMMDIPVWSMKN